MVCGSQWPVARKNGGQSSEDGGHRKISRERLRTSGLRFRVSGNSRRQEGVKMSRSRWLVKYESRKHEI